MTILHEILNRNIDPDKLSSLIEMPRNYLGEDIIATVPSLKMTNEGPVLTRVYLITKSFLCDVKISDYDDSNFDLLDRYLVSNIRVSKEHTVVNVGDESSVVYKTATVKILHTPLMESIMEFVGNERDEWLAAVLALFPASLAIGRR